MQINPRAQFVLATSLVAFFLGVGSTVSAKEAVSSKIMLNNKVAIEHFEVVAPLRGAQYAIGYFTLWNGTDKNIYLEKITDMSGRNFILQKSKIANRGQRWQNISLPKTIPPKSEFTANAELFRLIIDARALLNREGAKLPMLFQLVDGNPIEAYASVLPFGTNPTDHHHGLIDNE